MKLTKEECSKALRVMQYHMVRDPALCNLTDDKERWVLKPRFQRKVDIIKQLIEEHFDNPPLKWEELKPHMWVWDNKIKQYYQISGFYEGNGIVTYGLLNGIPVYKEGRFFRKQVEE